MKIEHHITASSDDPFWLEIEYLGLKYKDGGQTDFLGVRHYLPSVLVVTEDQPEWPEVERLLVEYSREFGPEDAKMAVFSKRDLDTAEWLTVPLATSLGEPKPEVGWYEQTYDPRSCRRCRIHGEQLAPYRVSGEPKAKSQFLQPNQIYDVLFVRPEAREGLARAGVTGIEFGRPLVVSAKGALSREAVQMEILSTLPPAIDTTDQQTVTCKPNNEEYEAVQPYLDSMPLFAEAAARTAAEREWIPYCGQVKYHVMHFGSFRFDRGAFEGAPDIVRSHEWFGAGGLAFRLVVVSQKFRQTVVASKWRGLVFEPIELTD